MILPMLLMMLCLGTVVHVRVLIETMLVEDGAVYTDDSSMIPFIFYRVKYVCFHKNKWILFKNAQFE